MKSVPWIYILGIVITGLGIAAVVLITIAVILQDPSDQNCQKDEASYTIAITKRVEDVLVAWYDLLSNEECNVSYRLRYWIDEGSAEEANVTQMYYTLPILETCSTLFVYLWIISSDGVQNENFTSKSYFEAPEKSAVSDVKFSNSNSGLNVTWSRMTSLDNCKTGYQSSMSADTGTMQYMETDSEYFHIPPHLYCLQINVTIRIVVNDLILDDSATTATYDDQEEIEDITIEPSPDDNTKVIVSWSKHIKQYWCSMEYEVEYINEDGEKQTVQVEGLTATFEAYYCSPSLVSVTAHNVLGGTSGLKTTLETITEPTKINQVINVYFSEDKTVISWGVLSSFRKCDLTYRLDFRTDLGDTCFTTKDTTFEVPEEIYSSSLMFEIRAVYKDISSDPVVSGVYTFGKVNSLTTAQKPTVFISGANEASISWDSPALANQDGDLEYTVTARNEYIDEESSCAGQNNCTLSLDDFCPTTNFIIRENTGVISELTITHNCY